MKQLLYKKAKRLFRFVAYILLPLTGGSWVGVSCTDTWDDHYESTVAGTGADIHEGSLWEAIKLNPQLSNFAKVLEATSYDKSLASSQVFTVFAPTNANFPESEANALISQYQQEKQSVKDKNNTVIKEFVQNHIALYNYSVSRNTHDSIVLMNGKYAVLQYGSIDRTPLSTINQLYENGVLYTVGSPVDYSANIFEYLKKDADLDSVRSFFYNPMFYREEFNASGSVEGGINELGQTVYLDSAFYQLNELYDIVGRVAAEDSTYWMTVPTNKAWRNLVEEYEPYFNYEDNVGRLLTNNDRDSLVYTNTRLAILTGTAFSETFNEDILNRRVTPSAEDSVRSVNGAREYSRREFLWGAPFNYYEYFGPQVEGGVLAEADSVVCSNGLLLKSDDWKLTSLNTFNRWIIAEAEYATFKTDKAGSDSLDITNRHFYSVINKDFEEKVWSDRFVLYTPQFPRVYMNFTIGITDVLSNMGYDIYLVTAPQLAGDTTATDKALWSTAVRPTLLWKNAQGVQQSQRLASSEVISGTSLEYHLLAEDFKFPVCTYGITEEEPSVKLQIEGRVGSSDKQRQQNIGIDCVLIVPHGTLELVDALPEVADVPQKYWGKPGVVMYPHGKNSKAYYKAR